MELKRLLTAEWFPNRREAERYKGSLHRNWELKVEMEPAGFYRGSGWVVKVYARGTRREDA